MTNLASAAVALILGTALIACSSSEDFGPSAEQLDAPRASGATTTAAATAPPRPKPQLSASEALQLYIQWMCNTREGQASLQRYMERFDRFNAEFDSGVWYFSYTSPINQGAGSPGTQRGKASMREESRVIIADSSTDDAQAAGLCSQAVR